MPEESKDRQIPLILLGVGFAIDVLAAFVHTHPDGVAPLLLFLVVVALVQTIILIGAALLVSSLLSVSFGEVPTAILKFAAAVVVGGAVGALIPFGGLIAFFVFLGMIMWLFELEIVYAIALSVAYWIISFVAGLILRGTA